MNDLPVDPAASPPLALLDLAKRLAERLSDLPAGVVGASHPLRLARALSLDVVDLIGASILGGSR